MYKQLFFILFFCKLTLNKPVYLSLLSDAEQSSNIVMTTTNQKLVMQAKANEGFSITQNEVKVLEYDVDKNDIETNYQLSTENDYILDSFENDFIFDTSNQWKLFEMDDFQQDTKGWSNYAVSNCGGSNNLFLGGHCNFASDAITKKFTLPTHKQILIQWNYHFLDEWTGEEGIVKLNGDIIWKETHTWCDKVMPWFCIKYGINSCGNEFPDRMSILGSYLGAHTDPELELTFTSTLTKTACQSSFGIDDLQIFIL